MGFPIGGKRVTCRGSKLTNSLGRTKLVNSLGKQNHEQIYKPAGVKQTISSQFSLVLSRYNKTLMTGPAGNNEFCFPSTSMFPEAKSRETLRVSNKTQFPLGRVIKCLFTDKPFGYSLEHVKGDIGSQKLQISANEPILSLSNFEYFVHSWVHAVG